ncbi:MAG: hypothetical protein ABDH20_03935, partial [Thermus sp.]
MRRFLALGFLLGLALAQGRLEGGVYASLASLGPTLEAALSLGEGEVYLRAQGGRAGLGYLGGLALGPLGYLAYGVQGELGEGGPGGVLFAEGGAGPLAFQGRLGYRPQGAFPLFPEAGPLAGFPSATAWCRGRWWASWWRGGGLPPRGHLRPEAGGHPHP